jgi:hypothetical protein
LRELVFLFETDGKRSHGAGVDMTTLWATWSISFW